MAIVATPLRKMAPPLQPAELKLNADVVAANEADVPCCEMTPPTASAVFFWNLHQHIGFTAWAHATQRACRHGAEGEIKEKPESPHVDPETLRSLSTRLMTEAEPPTWFPAPRRAPLVRGHVVKRGASKPSRRPPAARTCELAVFDGHRAL